MSVIATGLHVEAEMHDVAVLHDIFLAFETEFARLARARFAIEGDIIVVSDRLGPDEAFFKIGVNDAGRAWRPRAFRHGPGARLLGSGGEKRDEPEQIIAGADKPVEA